MKTGAELETSWRPVGDRAGGSDMSGFAIHSRTSGASPAHKTVGVVVGDEISIPQNYPRFYPRTSHSRHAKLRHRHNRHPVICAAELF